MRVVPLSQVKELTHNEVIPCVRGKVKACYKRRTGGEGDKTWSVQDMELDDGTATIKVKAWDHPELSQFKDRRVAVMAHDGPKGLSSVYAFDDEYQGKTSRIIKVTAAAKVEMEDGSPPANNTPQSSEQPPALGEQQPRPRTPAPRQDPPPGGNAAEDTRRVKATVARTARLYLMNFHSAVHIVDELRKKYGKDLPEVKFDDLRQIATTMQIEAMKSGLHNILPDAPIQEPKGGAQ